MGEGLEPGLDEGADSLLGHLAAAILLLDGLNALQLADDLPLSNSQVLLFGGPPQPAR